MPPCHLPQTSLIKSSTIGGPPPITGGAPERVPCCSQRLTASRYAATRSARATLRRHSRALRKTASPTSRCWGGVPRGVQGAGLTGEGGGVSGAGTGQPGGLGGRPTALILVWEGLQQGVERPPRLYKVTVPGLHIAIVGRRNAWEVGAVTRRLEGRHKRCVAPLGELVAGGTPPISSRSTIFGREMIHKQSQNYNLQGLIKG